MYAKLAFILACACLATAQVPVKLDESGNWLQGEVEDLRQKLDATVHGAEQHAQGLQEELEGHHDAGLRSIKDKFEELVQAAKDKVYAAIERAENTKADLSECKRQAAKSFGYARTQAVEVSHQCVSFHKQEVSDLQSTQRAASDALVALRKQVFSFLSSCGAKFPDDGLSRFQCRLNVLIDGLRNYNRLNRVYYAALGAAVRAVTLFPAKVSACELRMVKDVLKSTGAVSLAALDCVNVALHNLGRRTTKAPLELF